MRGLCIIVALMGVGTLGAGVFRLPRVMGECDVRGVVWKMETTGEGAPTAIGVADDGAAAWELVDGVRQWFRADSSGSFHRVLRETPISRATPAMPLPADVPGRSESVVFVAGEGAKFDTLQCEYTVAAERRGTLVLDGDSIPALLRTAVWVETDTCGFAGRTTRHRWLTAQKPAKPLALMTIYEVTDPAGKCIERAVTTYAIASEEAQSAVVKALIPSVTITGTTVSASIAADGVAVQISASNASGSAFTGPTRSVSPAPATLDLSGLPSGEYIVEVLAAESLHRFYICL